MSKPQRFRIREVTNLLDEKHYLLQYYVATHNWLVSKLFHDGEREEWVTVKEYPYRFVNKEFKTFSDAVDYAKGNYWNSIVVKEFTLPQDMKC